MQASANQSVVIAVADGYATPRNLASAMLAA